MLKPQQIKGFADWIYDQWDSQGGFRGSDQLTGALPREPSPPQPSSSRLPASTMSERSGLVNLAPANLIQSYTALLSLAILGDNFERLDPARLLAFVGRCQNQNGSYVASQP